MRLSSFILILSAFLFISCAKDKGTPGDVTFDRLAPSNPTLGGDGLIPRREIITADNPYSVIYAFERPTANSVPSQWINHEISVKAYYTAPEGNGDTGAEVRTYTSGQSVEVWVSMYSGVMNLIRLDLIGEKGEVLHQISFAGKTDQELVCEVGGPHSNPGLCQDYNKRAYPPLFELTKRSAAVIFTKDGSRAPELSDTDRLPLPDLLDRLRGE